MVEEYKGFKVPPLSKGAEEKVCYTIDGMRHHDCDSSKCNTPEYTDCFECLFFSHNCSAYEQWIKEHEEADED